MPFSAGETGAPFAQLRFVGERHPHDEFVGIGTPGSQKDLLRRGLPIAIGDVCRHRAAEQEWFLGNHADLPAKLPGIRLPHVDAVDADLPVIALVQAADETHQRRLARAAAAHYAHHLARLDRKYVLSAEHTERRFKERLTLRCFTWRTPQGQREFCAMLKKLDETLPLADLSGLAEPDLAGRFYLACRGVPDYLMTLVRGAAAEAILRKSECIELADLARIYQRKLAQQRVLAEQTNPFLGELDKAALDRVQAADQARAAGVGLTPRAAKARKREATAADFLGGRQ